MSVITFDQFLPQIAIYAADCPDIITIDALRKTANQFCRETSAWVITNDPQPAQANTAVYDIDSPSGTIVMTLLSVSYNGVPLSPKTTEQLDNMFASTSDNGGLVATPGPTPTASGTWAALVGTPAYYIRTANDEVQLVPMPGDDLDSAIVMRVAVAPHPMTGTGIDSDITDKFFEAIVAGALARVLILPGKWTNPQMAQFFGAQFTRLMSDARAVAYAANSSATLRVRGPRFF